MSKLFIVELTKRYQEATASLAFSNPCLLPGKKKPLNSDAELALSCILRIWLPAPLGHPESAAPQQEVN